MLLNCDAFVTNALFRSKGTIVRKVIHGCIPISLKSEYNGGYLQVRQITTHDILLIMDNCGGPFATDAYPGLRIEFSPERCTAKYQPLE